MALKLYNFDDEGTELLVNNTTNKLTSFHDTVDGSYYFNRFYLVNDQAIYGYDNIQVSVLIDDEASPAVSTNGIVYQLLATATADEIPADVSWQHLPYNNTAYAASIPTGAISRRYFLLRTYVPRGHGANYITEAKLNVSAIETI
jgi:hypothetical protein